MKSLWNDDEAACHHGDLAQRVYSSRLLGSDPTLVLHGGGNTSVKIRETNLVGEDEDILYVKGSGWDLATIEAAGFTPIRMTHLQKLAKLETLSDLQMVNELKTQQTVAGAPTGSVEAILHAVLPYPYVDHTHADAVITIANNPDGEARIRELYGQDTVIIPYVMPGFDLARKVAEQFSEEADDRTVGMVLMNHGIFSFGDTAKEAYERMIALVDRAERYLKAKDAWDIPLSQQDRTEAPQRVPIAELRRDLSDAAGFPCVLATHDDDRCLAFARRSDIDAISQRGPATPDHVIRTKRVPLMGRDLSAFAAVYRAYFDEHAPGARTPVQMLDPAPRVILDPVLGMMTAGKCAKEAMIVADIYRQTMDIIERAERLGGWRALPTRDIFDMEYWELEQAKLRKPGKAPLFQGEVALVTGAASGIGKACVESLLERGAAVIALDLSEDVTALFDRPDCLPVVCDVTDPEGVVDALEAGARRFGGLDMLILNAGLFPAGTPIADLEDAGWHRVMSVNLDANLTLLRECHPLLARAPRKGRVVVIGSKNVPAPGPGAAAYSSSKAALTQLMRVAALEWGGDGIRVNMLHPDAVFDTGVWTDEVLTARAAYYGMTVEEYKTKNLLGTEIRSRDVAELAAEMCGPLFAKTTGAQVPLDGGNDRVI